jgi:ribosomal protein S18 acetylase RimI-like enzyme
LPAEVVDIRHFTAHEFEPLLGTESRVWEQTLRWDYSSSRQMIATCLDDKRLSGYVLVDAGQLSGYSFFFYEDEKGLIGNLFVLPTASRLPQAHFLLEHVVQTVTGTPGIRRVETQLPHFTREELDPCFQPHGFEGYLRRFMALSLADWQRGTPRSGAARTPQAAEGSSLPVGFRLEPWERKYDRPASRLLFNTYRDHIDARINDQYGSLTGTSRLIENIVHHRGCGENIPEASRVAIHRPTQKLAGVLAVTAVRPRTAHIPQVAVAGEFQNAGLGTALMEVSFRELAQHGYEEVTLTVTDLNSAAVRFYERLGFETFRTFGAYVWKAR